MERNIRLIREGRQARGEPIPFQAQVEQAPKTKSRSLIDPALRTIRRECRARVRPARTNEAPFSNISAASGEDASEDTAQQIALTKLQKYWRPSSGDLAIGSPSERKTLGCRNGFGAAGSHR